MTEQQSEAVLGPAMRAELTLLPSVELTRSPAGKYSWRVRAYGASADEASEVAQRIDRELREVYGA